MHEVLSFFSIGYVKFKLVIHSFVASYTASTMRFFKQKRVGKNPTLQSWLYFGITALLISYSIFTLLYFFYPELPFPLVMTVVLWCAYNSDYFYSIVPKIMRRFVDNKLEPLISHNDSGNQKDQDANSDSSDIGDDSLRNSTDSPDYR
jgi:hypothetical protein